MRWVSIAIRDAITSNIPIASDAHPVAVAYPDQGMHVEVGFLDNADYQILAEYAATRPTNLIDAYPAMSALQDALPPSAVVLISRDRQRHRLNDRVFILRFTKQIGAVCAGCLREALRAAGKPTDLDFGIPQLSRSDNITPSPFVLRRLGCRTNPDF